MWLKPNATVISNSDFKETETMKRVVCAAIGITTLFAGCDGSVEKLGAILSDEPMTVVFAPGYEIAIDGKPAKVFGTDICPKEDRAMNVLFGPSSHEGSSDCLVISPTAKTVQARVVIDGKIWDEVWSVEHYEHKPFEVSLRRPDGLPVMAR